MPRPAQAQNLGTQTDTVWVRTFGGSGDDVAANFLLKSSTSMRPHFTWHC